MEYVKNVVPFGTLDII
nr:53 kda tungsten containing formylmethanofuran dehydrogenase {N-terminal} [Methanobacterium thermoautotrophicum, Marburg, DSM 2133, Peptide Partial, 16 aa] [Methanothermobacter thermautotrophicus]